MESITYLKNLKIAPKKVRFLLPRVKSMKPVNAVEVLAYMPDNSAKILYKAIKSAISNAKNTLKVDDSLLQFKTFFVEEGQKLKRFNPAGRGSARGYKRRYSHVKIVLVSSGAKKQLEIVADDQKKDDEVVQETAEKPKRKVVRKSIKKVVGKNSK